MTDPKGPMPEPPNLRFLRRLVTVLTAVMIGGLLVIVGLLVIRFSQPPAVVPDGITLPAGLTAEAFTLTPDWYAVVTEGGSRILIFSRRSGALLQTVEVESAP
ncbi:hypothetical protein CVM52_16140 [Pseudooceanicola lipolyticus]|uniref:Uncharacterized protein n=1 Tax=Pseudooceanicola lipolyticus TaxID=2029104 RepID=A0A2M8IYR0_9RHOB|nr:DUF6476 family protein [Pseudooceanicola lipolyticus]PJE35652.1 hypothetical protein CVM52_16140 [Pseudooceanicola lipolyticus]